MSQTLVKHILLQHGISHYGFTALERPLSIDIYKNWIKSDYHAGMNYLDQHTLQKENPHLLSPKAKSALVFTHPYPKQNEGFPLKQLKVAKYARGADYHYWLKLQAQNLCHDLKVLFPKEEFIPFTDSSPVLERELGYKAGLGWFGKNSCLLSRSEGSYFLIAEIYTSLELDSETPFSPDHCGTCNRCVEACPTQAILDNRTLDSNKCISYWSIEAKSSAPESLATHFSSWFFGCDICQDVCPWNGKVYKQLQVTPTDRIQLITEIKWLLDTSNNELERVFRHTPLLRARGRGLKRNALIVIANSQLHELKANVFTLIDHKELGNLAQWVHNSLSDPPSL